MDENLKIEEIKTLREFKASIFDLFWEKFGTFYIHILPHPNLEIGKRGLVGNENESGIVLVFGPHAVKSISSQPEYLYAELQFGYTWEKLIVPWDCIFGIYDKNQNSVIKMKVFNENIDFSDYTEEQENKKHIKDSKVIQVDFGAKRHKDE